MQVLPAAKQWIEPQPVDEGNVEALASAINVDPFIARMLVRRGINSFEKSKEFFTPANGDIHDPFLLKDMEGAANRVIEAMEEDQGVLIYGDYDVDGTTAVSMFYHYLKAHGLKVEFHVPDRYQEGYGVSKIGVDKAVEQGLQLMITLDCGIKDFDSILYAKEQGIDVIVCDHHLPGDTLPVADFIINPKRKDCDYPYGYLSGCAVGYKLLTAVDSLIPSPVGTEQYLDLVAISIACDIVPITGENRTLTHLGLSMLNLKPRPGIQAILEVSGRSQEMTAEDLTFSIGPRINAAGRMSHGKYVVELLNNHDLNAMKRIAQQIEAFNAERKAVDQDTALEALEQVSAMEDGDSRYSTVVYAEHWHKGVIGIVASRLMEFYYRPTIVMTKSNGLLTGSCRSTDDFDVCAGLSKCAELIEKYGGHHHAAGLTIKEENLEAFIKKFEKVVRDQTIEKITQPRLPLEDELELSQITERSYKILKRMEPFGPENPRPVFWARKVFNAGDSRVVGSDGTHLKLEVQQGATRFKGIAFRMAHHADHVLSGAPFDIAFTLSENTWNNKTTLQLQVADIRY